MPFSQKSRILIGSFGFSVSLIGCPASRPFSPDCAPQFQPSEGGQAPPLCSSQWCLFPCVASQSSFLHVCLCSLSDCIRLVWLMPHRNEENLLKCAKLNLCQHLLVRSEKCLPKVQHGSCSLYLFEFFIQKCVHFAICCLFLCLLCLQFTPFTLWFEWPACRVLIGCRRLPYKDIGCSRGRKWSKEEVESRLSETADGAPWGRLPHLFDPSPPLLLTFCSIASSFMIIPSPVFGREKPVSVVRQWWYLLHTVWRKAS